MHFRDRWVQRFFFAQNFPWHFKNLPFSPTKFPSHWFLECTGDISQPLKAPQPGVAPTYTDNRGNSAAKQVSSDIRCTNAAFGTDPKPGTSKFCTCNPGVAPRRPPGGLALCSVAAPRSVAIPKGDLVALPPALSVLQGTACSAPPTGAPASATARCTTVPAPAMHLFAFLQTSRGGGAAASRLDFGGPPAGLLLGEGPGCGFQHEVPECCLFSWVAQHPLGYEKEACCVTIHLLDSFGPTMAHPSRGSIPATCQLLKNGIQPPWVIPPKIAHPPKTNSQLRPEPGRKKLFWRTKKLVQ